eukprot:scaffold73965_cov44-Attheya_sp.AAC.1
MAYQLVILGSSNGKAVLTCDGYCTVKPEFGCDETGSKYLGWCPLTYLLTKSHQVSPSLTRSHQVSPSPAKSTRGLLTSYGKYYPVRGLSCYGTPAIRSFPIFVGSRNNRTH